MSTLLVLAMVLYSNISDKTKQSEPDPNQQEIVVVDGASQSWHIAVSHSRSWCDTLSH